MTNALGFQKLPPDVVREFGGPHLPRRVHLDEAVSADSVFPEPGFLDHLRPSEVVACLEVERAELTVGQFHYQDGVSTRRICPNLYRFVRCRAAHAGSLYERLAE
jgi:hypothetical protein